MVENHYQLLGVPTSATPEAIRHAYREKAKELHPDLHRSESQELQVAYSNQMSKVSQAYEILSDPTKRSQYDQLISQQLLLNSPAKDEAKVDGHNYSSSKDNCTLCGHAPTEMVNFRYLAGFFLFFKVTRLGGRLCRDCGRNTGREAQNKSLLYGWWGYAIPINIFVIILNSRELMRLRLLSSQTAGSKESTTAISKPLPSGRSTFLRPGFTISLIGLVLAISAITHL